MGSAAAVAGIISISVVDEIGLIPTVLLASLIGIAYGSLQGYLIYRLRIQSLVFTLGTLIGLRGLAFMISGENTVVMRDLEMAHAVRRQLWIFSPFSLVTLACFVLVGLFLVNTRFGREIYAIGGGRQEAAAAGVPLVRPLVLAFALSGAMAALTGALTSIKSGSAGPARWSAAWMRRSVRLWNLRRRPRRQTSLNNNRTDQLSLPDVHAEVAELADAPA